MHPFSHVASNRRQGSSAPAASLGLPISMFDRSYNHHRDSTSSMENFVVRAAWTCFMGRALSYVFIYSVLRDYLGVHLGRPRFCSLDSKVMSSIQMITTPLAAISMLPPRMLIRSEHPT